MLRVNQAAEPGSILAALQAIADDGRLDPWDRTGRQLPIRPLPDDALRVSRVVRRVLLGAKGPMDATEIAERAARLAGATHAARVRQDVARLLRSRPHMFRQHEGAFRLAGTLPPQRQWLVDQIAGPCIPQVRDLEPGPWLDAARRLAARIDAEPATTPRFLLWDHESRRPLVEFSLALFFDDTPGAHDAVMCVVAVACLAGSQLVELLTAAGWRWRPSHVAQPRATAFDPYFIEDPDNLVTLEVGAATTLGAAGSVLRAVRDHLGIRDPERVTVLLEPLDAVRAAAVLEHLRLLRAAFHPPQGSGGGRLGDDETRLPKRVLATCIVCGRDLTDPSTASRLMGDDCRRRVLNHATNLRLLAPGNDLAGYIDRVAASRQAKHLWARAVPESQWAQADRDGYRQRLEQ